MRVIAGTARGILLTAPDGFSTRPTSGRLRENLFNILSPLITGANFLDLFGGSGAIGIEALSRGAKHVVFVEQERGAAAVIKSNLIKTKLTDKAEILIVPVRRAAERLSSENKTFDIIFLDPPYESNLADETVRLIAEAKLLSPGGTLAAELPADKELPDYEAFEVKRTKIYGDKKFILWNGAQ